MNITISVALITSLATLLAGFAGSVTSLWVQRSQIRAQATLASTERVTQRNTQLREIRRKAYAELLGYFNKMDNVMQECWELSPSTLTGRPLPSEINEAGHAIAAGAAVLNVVDLEGPQSVAEAGASASSALRSELSTIMKLMADSADNTDMLLVVASDDYGRALQKRQEVRQALTKAARTALEETL
jgi:hypothetical protein